MLRDGWQDGLIDELRALVEPDDDVRALVVFGSWVTSEFRDRFSDVDVLLVIRDGAGPRFFPSRDWLLAIGALFAAERSNYDRSGVHRVCFDDGRRLDVVVVEEHVIAAVEQWPQHPLRSPRRTVFSRSPATDRAVAEVFDSVPARPPSQEQFALRVDEFWFEAQLAVHKTVRADLLMASHLLLGSMRHCLELTMLLRDRAAGTRYHRHGAATDAAVLARIEASRRQLTAAGLLDALGEAAVVFDDLASEWDTGYARRTGLLKNLIAVARKAL